MTPLRGSSFWVNNQTKPANKGGFSVGGKANETSRSFGLTLRKVHSSDPLYLKQLRKTSKPRIPCGANSFRYNILDATHLL